MTVFWREEALADVDRLARHIAEENSFAARRMVREILLAGDSSAGRRQP